MLSPPCQDSDASSTSRVISLERVHYPAAIALKWKMLRMYKNSALINPYTGEYQYDINWHFRDEIAQLAGLPRAHSLGVQNEANIAHLICNWMGDDGFGRRLQLQQRAVLLYGDMSWQRGRVVKKYV